jgi:nucleoside-diphosphate-sugar epimerase
MRVLITGASGFIGRNLINYFSSHYGNQATLFTLSRNPASTFSGRIEKQFSGNLLDKKSLESCIKEAQPDVIIHAAAFKERENNFDSFYDAIQNNLLGTLNIAYLAATLSDLKRFIVFGTVSEYGYQNIAPYLETMVAKPDNAYALSKLLQVQLCEALCRIKNLPYVVLRPTIVYGPMQGRGMLIPDLIVNLIQSKEFSISSGTQSRDFVYVEDVVSAVNQACCLDVAIGEVFNVGSGQPTQILCLAKKIAQMLGKEHLLKIDSSLDRQNEMMDYYADISKISEKLNWKPQFNLDEGLSRAVQYYLSKNVY